jgi:hypothetical protein
VNPSGGARKGAGRKNGKRTSDTIQITVRVKEPDRSAEKSGEVIIVSARYASAKGVPNLEIQGPLTPLFISKDPTFPLSWFLERKEF